MTNDSVPGDSQDALAGAADILPESPPSSGDTSRTDVPLILSDSDRRFRIMADTAPVMIWMADTNGQCDWFNHPWLEFRGRTLEEEFGEGWNEGIHPDDRDYCLTTYWDSFQTQQSFRMEYRLQRYDGEYRWVLDTGTPRYETDGTFAGFIGSCLDVSDIKEAQEQRLRLEEERARHARELHEAAQRQKRLMRELIAGITNNRLMICESDDDLPPLLAEFGPSVELSRSTLRLLRRQAREAAENIGMPEDRTHDLLTAVSEAAMNAVMHADGGEGSVFKDDKVQVRVEDQGEGIDESILHRATLERGFSTRSSFGHGFWLMVRTADRVYLRTGPEGTTVVLEKERLASPGTAWPMPF